jgi:rare lipoprotein A
MSHAPQLRARERASLAVVSLSVALCALAGEATAKKPGGTYCFNGVCHRVKTIAETSADVGQVQRVRASFYDDCEVDPGNPCTKPSSGEALRADLADNAASPVYPDGTVLALWNPAKMRAARVRINNSGPYVKGRLLDVSRATAQALGFIDAGVTELQIKVVAAPPGDGDVNGSGPLQSASAQN